MTVLVAVTDSREGRRAQEAGIEEARLLDTKFVLINLGPSELDTSLVPDHVPYAVVDRSGTEHHDPVEAVLNLIEAEPGIGRLLRVPVPAGAVKLPE